MSVTFTLPKEYGYVLATATFSTFLGMWHGLRVGGFRRAAKVPYPNAYATQESIDAASADPGRAKALYLFNCAQRAHANYLENHPSTLVAMLVGGVGYPLTAAGLGAAWCVFRILYARGYTRADRDGGKGRLVGSGFWLMEMGLFGLVGKMAWDMLMA